MNLNRIVFIIASVVFNSGVLAPSTAQINAQFDHAKTLLIEARDKIFNFDKNDTLIEKDIYQSQLIFNQLSSPRDRLYWSAQTEYYEGLFFLKKQMLKDAEFHFTKCNSLLTKAIKEYGDFSEAYSLLADSYMQIMLNKGITYQILNGQKLKFFPERALQLDSANIKAYQSLAVYCMNAPEALGGGIHRAIDLLVKLSSKDKGEMFKIYYLLGNAYMKIHNTVLASQYLQRALTLYPQNKWAEDDLESMTSKKIVK